jgi:cellulase/cellobiase CelA1
MSFAAASTNLMVGDTTTLTFSTNLGIPQYTLRADGDRIAVFLSSGAPIVYNESPLVQMINTSYPLVIQVLAPGALDLQLAVNGETFEYSSPEQGCLQFWYFTTLADSLTLNVTPTPTATPTATPGTGAACTIMYDVQQQWGNGFIANVTIGVDTAVSGWTLEFDFPGNQTIINMWGGLYAQSGSAITVDNEAWNGEIAANGSTSFGFQARFSESNDIPVDFILNGQACD